MENRDVSGCFFEFQIIQFVQTRLASTKKQVISSSLDYNAFFYYYYHIAFFSPTTSSDIFTLVPIPQ